MTERMYKTNLKTFEFPLFHKEKGLDKKYRGLDYPLVKAQEISSQLGRYRGIEHQVTVRF
tara:strand:+ start:419 stop:598 length:180 start_codon:yes stop_codon:yes gene_type:complete